MYIVLVAFTSFEYRSDVLHLEIVDACMEYTLYFFFGTRKMYIMKYEYTSSIMQYNVSNGKSITKITIFVYSILSIFKKITAMCVYILWITSVSLKSWAAEILIFYNVHVNRWNYKRVNKFTVVWQSIVLNKLQSLQFHPLCTVIFLYHWITMSIVNGWVSKIKGPNYFNIIIKHTSLKTKIYIHFLV